MGVVEGSETSGEDEEDEDDQVSLDGPSQQVLVPPAASALLRQGLVIIPGEMVGCE